MSEHPQRLATPAMVIGVLGAPPAGARDRVLGGVPEGGRFTGAVHAATGPTLEPELCPARFGPNGVHVQALIDRVAGMTAADAARLGSHAPIVTVHGRTSEMFCPNADAIAYGNLARYRRITRAHAGDTSAGSLHDEVAAALEEAEAAATTAGLPSASRCAVKDAAVALVTAGTVHAVAYDTLTRAVRIALGPIHPGDTPVRN